jgi:hypothetical protein
MQDVDMTTSSLFRSHLSRDLLLLQTGDYDGTRIHVVLSSSCHSLLYYLLHFSLVDQGYGSESSDDDDSLD